MARATSGFSRRLFALAIDNILAGATGLVTTPVGYDIGIARAWKKKSRQDSPAH